MSAQTAPIPAASPPRSPITELIAIAAPTVATMTSYTLMQFVDKLMVSRIGPDPIYVGAQGNGGLSSWVPISIMMGLLTVINTFVSQNLGAGRSERAPAYAWAGLWLSVVYWLLVLIPLAMLLPLAYAAMREPGLSPDRLAQVLLRDRLAADYGRILLLGGVITLAARGISQYFYGMHRPGVVLIATVVGNITNLVLNTVLIFGPHAPAHTGIALVDGWFALTARFCDAAGVPQLGISGSAYATVIGTLVEAAIPFSVFLSPRFRTLYGTARSWRPSALVMKDLLHVGWPGALMFGNEMICWAFFMVYLVGQFGPVHSTAGWIAHQWMTLSFMPTVGISVAITATVGKCIGMGRIDLAAQRAWTGLGLAVTYMTLCGLCFLIFRRQLIEFFIDASTPPEVRSQLIAIGSQFLIATAAFQFFDGVAMSLSGALRGAGDTHWPGIVTVLLSWSIIVLGGLALVRFAPGLSSLGPWIAAAAYISTLSVAMFFRFVNGRWKSIRLLDHSGPQPASPEPAPVTEGPAPGVPEGLRVDPGPGSDTAR